MKTKIIQFVPALTMSVSIGFVYLSRWCIDTYPSCYGSWVHRIYSDFTQPLYFFALYALPLAVILIFVSRPVFKSWIKLAAWLLPIAFILVATTDVTSSQGFGMDLFPYSRDDSARQTAEIFTIISLILIIWKHFSLSRVNPKDV